MSTRQHWCPSAARAARFADLIHVHVPMLEGVARKLELDAAAAADLVQDTLERAWRHFDTLQDAERARPWLMRILRNTWADRVRRRRPEVPIDETHEPAVAAMAAGDELSWWQRVTLDDIRRAIAQLQEPFRSVAELGDLGGHSYREIARRLAIPNATAASRLHRAHCRIRALLQRELGAAESA